MTLRIFFASDVHGSDRCFIKFINAGKFYNVDVLILGGDITGKGIVPIVAQPDGTYTSIYMDTEYILKTKEELERYESIIRFSGFYPYRTDPSEIERLNSKKELVDELFSRLMIERVKSWINIASERLKNTSIKCFISPGNDDRFVIDEVLNDSDVIVNPEEKVVNIDKNHEMITLGWANPTPWHTPRECSESELASKIESLIADVKGVENCIFNFHCPPFQSGLDLAPKLDDELRPAAAHELISVGSIAVREAILKYKPLLGLHGHIHESRGVQKLGRTICINPGSEYSEGILRGVIVVLDDKKIKNYMLVAG